MSPCAFGVAPAILGDAEAHAQPRMSFDLTMNC